MEIIMHNGNRTFLSVIENYVDMLINILAIIGAYVLSAAVANEEKVEYVKLESPLTIALIFLNIILLSFTYHAMNMYRHDRYMKAYHRFPEVLRANFIYFGIMTAIMLMVTRVGYREFLLWWFLFAFLLSTAFLTFKRHLIRSILRAMRRNDINLKRVIIVGDNTQTTEDYIKQSEANANYGIVVLGYVGDKINPSVGAEKLGTFKDLAKILDKYHPTDVVFAIDSYDKRHLIRLVNICDDRCIKVYFLPVIYGFFKNQRQIEQIGNMPVINIHSTPLDNGANALVKRIVDVVGSILLIIATAPIMIAAAIGVKLSSPGPVFFKQTRVGKLGKKFVMFKFRSMKVNKAANRTWTKGDDTRKTKFGTFLRKTAIDELPQLFNVLGGSMSLVGPRPELPVFVQHFKEDIPLYMVKHYVKPGLTGLAQIKGLRGDTSVVDRIHEDIAYIENWSLLLDIYILLKTPFKAFNKAERYVEEAKPAEAKPEPAPIPETPVVSAPEREVKMRHKPLSGMRILYVASNMEHIKNFHLDYISSLRSFGNDVFVMANGEGADYNVPFTKRFFAKENKEARKQIRKIVKENDFDIIILHTSLAAFHVRLAVPRGKRPRIVNVVHGYLFTHGTKLVKKLALILAEKFSRAKTDAIVVMNNEDLKIAKRNRFTAGKVYFSRGMGVKNKPVTKPRDEFRRELGAQNDFVLNFVGELSGRKNQSFLISAMPKIKESIPNAKLWLVGEGDAREILQNQINDMGLAHDITLFGRREDAGNFMNACDVYVSASKSEGLPFNIVEALGVGRPVVASYTKGHEDVIVDGVSGYLYELDNIEDFVERIVKIYNGIEPLDKRNIVARGQLYSYEEVFDDTLQIMMEAADEAADYRNR